MAAAPVSAINGDPRIWGSKGTHNIFSVSFTAYKTHRLSREIPLAPWLRLLIAYTVLGWLVVLTKDT